MASRCTVYEPAEKASVRRRGDDPNGQRVTVDFIERGDGTEVRLIHETSRTRYGEYAQAGWTAALGKLANQLAAEIAS